MTVLYFSSTGNCLMVAKSFGGVVKSIPQLIKNDEYLIEDDKVGIVLPTYSLGIPNFIKEYLSKVNIKATYIFGVITYGRFGGIAAEQLMRTLEINGNKLDYVEYLLMVDNFLPGFDMESEVRRNAVKLIDVKIEKIKSDINSERKFLSQEKLLIKKVGYVVNKFLYSSEKARLRTNRNDRKFIINDNCNSCGTCAKVCPVSNISIDTTPQYHNKCEYCLGCIHICPVNAIHMKGQRSKARFRNSKITIKDIIDSNCQI